MHAKWFNYHYIRLIMQSVNKLQAVDDVSMVVNLDHRGFRDHGQLKNGERQMDFFGKAAERPKMY